jgi:molybdopterin synthase sulfur carrier subunit
MKVEASSVLHSYTGGKSEVEAEGATLDALFDDLNRRFPGLRFRVVDEAGRIRPTMLVCVGAEVCRDLARPLGASEDVRILHALSGG